VILEVAILNIDLESDAFPTVERYERTSSRLRGA